MLGTWISPFPYPGLYRFMQNYPRSLDLRQWRQKKKKHIFNILGSREKTLKNFTLDLDVPKLIALDEDKG